MSYRFMRYPEGKAKAVTLSYDDGAKHDLRLAEICNKYSVKCTFNVCKALSENKNNITAKEIEKYILSAGHEVAVHGYEHKAPGKCTDIEIVKDVLTCRENLESTFNIIIRGMAYPDTGITTVNKNRYEEIKGILKNLGIVYARTLGKDNNMFDLPVDWHAWMPTAHHDNPKVFEYAEEFAKIDADNIYRASRHPRLFYLWGHSFEFDRNDNWSRLEDILKILANKEDTWYAANIEIYDYVKAYESLIFNSSNSQVYNPTLQDVWFNFKGKTYCVKSGETIEY